MDYVRSCCREASAFYVAHQNAIFHPIQAFQGCMREQAHRISSFVHRLLERIGRELFEKRFVLIYAASASIVALHNPPLFIASACTGALFSFLQMQSFPSTRNLLRDRPNELCKTPMMIQTTCTIINVLANFFSRPTCIGYSQEGSISEALSGFLLGHLITSQLQ